MSVIEDKAKVRKGFLGIRQDMHIEDVAFKSKVIYSLVLSSPEYEKARGVFVYVSCQNEPSTREIIQDALKKGKKVFVPYFKKDICMQALRVNSIDELDFSCKIPLPPYEQQRVAGDLDIDLVIVPGIAFDKSLNRVGFGAGCYDGCLKDMKAFKMALCYKWQIVDRLSMEPHDIPMDAIVTEEGIITKNI